MTQDPITATIYIPGQPGINGLDGAPGENGVNSKEAGTGQPGTNGSGGGVFDPCKCATNGTKGANGVTAGGLANGGATGDDGHNLVLTVGQFVVTGNTNITITGIGGAGGTGGVGGVGGGGDSGGNAGTNKQNCITNGKCQPATGGYGGDGMGGGVGGNAGNGGSGGNITIYYVSANNINKVVVQSLSGPAGTPGGGGAGGAGGPGGKNEVFPPNSPQTYAPHGNPGLQPGSGNAGFVGGQGTVIIQQISNLP